jgi:hypothetical protein
MLKSYSKLLERRFLREFLIFAAFAVLTVIMTWPWVVHIRDAVSDPGDPYISAWTLWWDYHQTFHDPLNLFQANTGYPYQDSLAFGENAYGIAMLCFPLFALGLRPLTVLGVATLSGFAFSGYGAFRLTRTLTGSLAIAWVAGIVFGFIPYRFLRLSSIHYLFTGWIPLVFEALILFVRARSWKRAIWFAVVFLMNGLTAITWFILTLIPLALLAIALLVRYRIWRDATFWKRGGIALCAGLLVLLPFLIPYHKVSELYGFRRTYSEADAFSAYPVHWLVVDSRNKLWSGLGSQIPQNSELALFPGLLPVLFTLAALLLVEPQQHAKSNGASVRAAHGPPRILLVLFDVLAITSLIVALLAIGYGVFQPRILGFALFKAKSPNIALMISASLLAIRCTLARPEVFRRMRDANVSQALRSGRRSEAFLLGTILVVLGFAGSLGVHFFFQRFLFQNVPIFRSMRVWAHWSIYCYLGLALLAGLGTERFAARVARWQPKLRAKVVFALIVLAFLFEQRVAPLSFARGEVDADALTLRLKETPMAGGLVELPANQQGGYFRYTLRAADHGRPLVTFANSFITPTQQEIERLTAMTPIPDSFLNLLESIPASYLVLHYGTLTNLECQKLEDLLRRGVASGRLRFIRSYQDSERKDLYAVTKTEPAAQTDDPGQ